MAEGFQGPGYPDPVTGEWIATPGLSVNSVPRPITTPNSSTGMPQYLDPSASSVPEIATNKGFLTPNSRTGAPAAGPPTIEGDLTGQSLTARTPAPYAPGSPPPNPFRNLPIGGPAISAIGALAANQPTEAQVTERLNNPLTLKELATAAQQYLWPQTDTQPQPRTQPGPGRSPSGPVPPSPPPPFGPAGPPNYLPPFNRGPIPPYLPQRGPASTGIAQQPGGGAGSVPQAAAAPPAPAPQNINLGHYRATVGNARGNPTWVPGGEDAPAPQIFRGAQTAWGAPNYGQGPRGPQNYYQPGSAPMAPGDWTGTAGPFVPPNQANIPGAMATPVSGRGGAPGGFAPNAAMMNNAAAGDQMMGGNTFAGNPYGQTQRGAPPPMPPRRPAPGGFGYNPLNFFGAGP